MRAPFLSALLVAFAVLLSRAVEPAPAPDAKPSNEVFALIEKEIERLESQEKAETAPVWPGPSSEVAYLLLQGLASRGSLVAKPSDEENKVFHLEPRGGTLSRLYSLTQERRLVKEVFAALPHMLARRVSLSGFESWPRSSLSIAFNSNRRCPLLAGQASWIQPGRLRS